MDSSLLYTHPTYPLYQNFPFHYLFAFYFTQMEMTSTFCFSVAINYELKIAGTQMATTFYDASQSSMLPAYKWKSNKVCTTNKNGVVHLKSSLDSQETSFDVGLFTVILPPVAISKKTTKNKKMIKNESRTNYYGSLECSKPSLQFYICNMGSWKPPFIKFVHLSSKEKFWCTSTEILFIS